MYLLCQLVLVYRNALMLLIVLGCLPGSLLATTLSLNISNPNRISAPGDTETFSGTIGNGTGSILDSADLSLNFAGFDPSHVSLIQSLQPSPFTVIAGGTSATVDFFTATLAGDTKPGLYLVDVVLEDVNNNMSNVASVSLRVVPEPSTWLFIVVAGLGLIALGRHARSP